MNLKKIMIYVILSGLIFCFYSFGRGIWHPVYVKVAGKKTVEDIIEKYGGKAQARLQPYFEKAGVPLPPVKLILVGIKDEKILEIWADDGKKLKLIRKYPIQAASGRIGPKLREGDRQVPEGIYRIIDLNPNSSYHLSIKLDYPNSYDLKYAGEEGRTEPGSDIFIHGRDVSIGCPAMGDEAIEELFILVYQTGAENVKVILTPYDFRKKLLHISMPKK